MTARLIIAAFGLVPLAGWGATAEMADLVFLGGHIVTADAQGTTAQALAFGGALMPFLLYRPSRSWGLMNYYIFAPEELPANGGTPPARDRK